jgi:hypothetical protein
MEALQSLLYFLPPLTVFLIGMFLLIHVLFFQKKPNTHSTRLRIAAVVFVFYGILGVYLDFLNKDGYTFTEYIIETLLIGPDFFPPEFFIPIDLLILALGVIYFLNKKLLLMKTTLTLWILYAIYEFSLQMTCPECNIRLDLLLIYPVLIAFTIAAFVTSIKKK